MNKQDLPAIIAMEECAEVTQAISKVFRFGPNQVWQDMSNKENLEVEIGQLLYAINQLTLVWHLDTAAIDDAFTEKKLTSKQWETYFPESENDS